MNPSKFDQIVKNRAQERVNDKVKDFKRAVADAIYKLGLGLCVDCGTGYRPSTITRNDNLRHILENVGKGLEYEPQAEVSNNTPYKALTWPRELWDIETKAVEKELLSVMDEMSKALAAPAPTEDSVQPAEEPPKV